MQPDFDGDKEILIKCFGQLAIYVDGIEQSAQMNSMKARELIAFLLTYKGKAVHKDKVCEALWGDKKEKQRRDSLCKLLKKIEKMEIPFMIEKSRDMIQLRIDNIECDLITFEQLMNDEQDIEKMEKAVRLYDRGTLYEEEDYEWILDKDGVYDYKYFDMLSQLCSHYEKSDKDKASQYRHLLDDWSG